MKNGKTPRHCIVIDRSGKPHPKEMGKIKRKEFIRFHSPCRPATLTFYKAEVFEKSAVQIPSGSVDVSIKDTAPDGAFKYSVRVSNWLMEESTFSPETFPGYATAETGGEGGGEVGG